MAVMASHSPEPAVSETNPASATGKDERNGSIEVNGHTSPVDASSTSKSRSPLPSSSKDHVEMNGTDHAEDKPPSAPAPAPAPAPDATVEVESQKLKPSESEEAQPANPADSSETDLAGDTEMADAQVDTPVVDSEKKSTPAEATSATAAAESSSPKPTDKASSPDARDDVDMIDTSTAAAAPTSGEQEPETQDTAISDLPPATPVEDLSLHPASMSSLAIDATQTSPDAAATANTSMSDPPQSPVKVARGRDEDDEEDGPAAKRVKTDPPSESGEASTSKPDEMDVDKPASKGATSTLAEDGKPKNLADPSLDGNEITKYQSQKIRMILAGIKKTKAGGPFKQPVVDLWPALWEDYRTKVPHPTDIGTMEKRLKNAGDPNYPPYPTLGDFKEDLGRLHGNALLYNGESHDITKAGLTVRDQVLERMSALPAQESAVEEKKTVKQHPTRHAEPRAAAHPPPPSGQQPRRPSKAAVPSPVDKVAQSPAFAIPPNNHGVPLIRRDSTKNTDDRPKRPVHPPKTKDFGYDLKRKKKLSPDLQFCAEILQELQKAKYNSMTAYFLRPVDPVADNIPNYYKIIRKPMDLQTMGEKLHTGQYTSSKEFQKDFDLIIKNARTYNGEGSYVTLAATDLEGLFKEEWAKRDAWMTRHAPTVAPQASVRAAIRDDSDDDDEEDEPEVEEKEQTSATLEALQQRLKEENDKINELMTARNPDLSMVEVSQTMVALLQKQIISERQKLADAVPVKKPAKKAAAKPKKPSGGNKKATGSAGGASGGGASGGSKKMGGGSKKATKRVMGVLEKEVIGAAIPDLDGALLERAIDIIKKDTNQNENDSGELELDIEALSQDALVKLYDMSIKSFPHLRQEKERAMATIAPPPVEQPAAKPRPTKPKKNKPMGKAEQEARLRQLSDLKAALKGRGSGSQEPIESIEGNGGQQSTGEPQQQQQQHLTPESEEDEESSEEE